MNSRKPWIFSWPGAPRASKVQAEENDGNFAATCADDVELWCKRKRLVNHDRGYMDSSYPPQKRQDRKVTSYQFAVNQFLWCLGSRTNKDIPRAINIWWVGLNYNNFHRGHRQKWSYFILVKLHNSVRSWGTEQNPWSQKQGLIMVHETWLEWAFHHRKLLVGTLQPWLERWPTSCKSWRIRWLRRIFFRDFAAVLTIQLEHPPWNWH